jgi:hypothetical protein
MSDDFDDLMADYEDHPQAKSLLFECSFQLLMGLNLANFFLWMALHGLFCGGYGLYGAMEDNGRYLLYDKYGKTMEVSKATYLYSTWHTQTLIWLFVLLCVGMLLATVIEAVSTLRRKFRR